MLNLSLAKFKSQFLRKKNQIVYYSTKTDGQKEIDNLINNFLIEKNSFIFESVEKGRIKGRYTIFGKNPDKIWEFNNENSYLIKNKKYSLRDWSYHNHRNGDINRYILAAEELTKRGYYVFRMGTKVSTPMKSSNSKIFD